MEKKCFEATMSEYFELHMQRVNGCVDDTLIKAMQAFRRCCIKISY